MAELSIGASRLRIDIGDWGLWHRPARDKGGDGYSRCAVSAVADKLIHPGP
jgi:hypothetical protein